MSRPGPSTARAVALAGAALAAGSVPLGYLRTDGRVAGVDPSWLSAGLAVALLAGAALTLCDHTRGEQLLGGVAGAAVALVVAGRLAGVAVTARPGLAAAVVAWGLVEWADLLDPRLAHPRVGRWLPLTAVGLTVAGCLLALGARGPAAAAVGVGTVGAWLVAVAWELTATRQASGSASVSASGR